MTGTCTCGGPGVWQGDVSRGELVVRCAECGRGFTAVDVSGSVA